MVKNRRNLSPAWFLSELSSNMCWDCFPFSQVTAVIWSQPTELAGKLDPDESQSTFREVCICE